MTTAATITSLRPSDIAGVWQIAFCPVEAGDYHQLYLDGELQAVTHSPSQRTFLVRSTSAPQTITILATPWATRHQPQSLPAPGWTHRPRVLREVRHHPGEQIELLCDDAQGGEITLAESADSWDDTHPHWGFANGELGRGGFGVDGDLAPGLGGGAFGAGPLGFDSSEIPLAIHLPRTGLFCLRLQTRHGESISATVNYTLAATVPPPPLAAIHATLYSPTTQHLSLEVFDV